MGDCAIVKAKDIQESTELILEMVAKCQEGNKRNTLSWACIFKS